MHEEMSVYVFVAVFVCVQIEMFMFTHGDNSVCAHVNACVLVEMFVCLCTWRKKGNISCLPLTFPTMVLRQALSLNLETTNLAGPVVQ